MKHTIEYFAMMEPMKYYNNEADVPKRRDMIENKDDLYVGSTKHDGDWGMFIHFSEGHNLIRSRSISKVTGVYGDYTDKLPHLCDDMNKWPDNTVILAEICWDEAGTNANTVGTILRCLPPKAVERQKEHKLSGLAFDMLMFNGDDLVDAPYIDRLTHAQNFIEGNSFDYFKMTNIFYDNFQEHADEIIRNGGEGLVIQMKSNPYMPGTRTAWKTLKLKQKMQSAEYPVVGIIKPTREYNGDCREAWKYWAIGYNGGTGDEWDLKEKLIETEGGQPNLGEDELAVCPVTKPYFFGWNNGVRIKLPSGIETDVASGLTDEDREWLATTNAYEEVDAGNLYAEVAAMSINDLGKLRHAYIVKLRVKEDGANE